MAGGAERRTLEALRAEVARGAPFRRGIAAELRGDNRAGAALIYESYLRVLRKRNAEKRRLRRMMECEEAVRSKGYAVVAGVDEAGRGPLAGPIVAGAVVLAQPLDGLNDSKQLEEPQRETLFELLCAGGHCIGVSVVSHEEIDRIGIQRANYAAMARALAQIDPPPHYVLIDGFRVPDITLPQEHLIKGDGRSLSIAAASIIAKVTRDRLMREFDAKYPAYGFARHKGYSTPEHLAALDRYGPCPIHRQSFAPVWKAQDTGMFFECFEEA